MRFALLAACALTASSVAAHDTWVETNTNLIRSGDAVAIQLMLGNHGNDHRDFKLASKVGLEGCTLEVVAPDGTRYDVRDRLADLGYTPTEGFWSTRFAARDPGLYLVSHTYDRVVNHGRPIRSRKSGKTCFVVSPSLDRVTQDNPGFDRPLGHPFELVPTANPVTPMGPGQPMAVQLLFNGQPLPESRISFIPRGTVLGEGFDPEYERMTDAEGRATFSPRAGGTYLVVAHRTVEGESGEGFEATIYSATLTVFVPEICPCCGE